MLMENDTFHFDFLSWGGKKPMENVTKNVDILPEESDLDANVFYARK